MNRESFKLARDTLRLAVRDYGWRREMPDGFGRWRAGKKRYVTGPGKFEGEHWSVVHYYETALDHNCDAPLYYADGTVAADIMIVLDVERDAFKLNADTHFVVLWYSEQGFVSMQELTATEYDNVREAWAIDHPGERES